MTSFAVVILNYNGEKLLPQFLPSVIQNSAGARIIVVDNGSTDSSVKLIKKTFGQVELIQFENNLGYCGGYNRAIGQIVSDVVILLNSDIEVTPGWLDSPMKLLASNPIVAAVQPKILSYQNKTQFEYAGAAGGFIDLLGYPFCRGRIFQTLEFDEGQYNDQSRIFWASGACLIIKREKFLEAGGFDEDFFAHMEEIDLCWRLNRAGYEICYDSQSIVYHVGGGTLSAGSSKKVYYNFRNGLTLLIKNLTLTGLLLKLPFRIVLDYVAALGFILKGKPGSGWAVIQAHLSSVANIGRNLTKRFRNRRIGFKISNKLVINKLLLLEYYILKRTKFTAIKNPK